MRLLLAALFVCVGLGISVVFLFPTSNSPPSGYSNVLICGLFFMLVILAFRVFNRRAPNKPEKVTFDSERVTRFRSDGQTETIRWDDLEEVGILTTSDGPWAPDLFWVLVGKDRQSGCTVPGEAGGTKELFARLQQLPDFDNEAVITAMGSTTEATFVCWKKGGIKSNIKAE